MGWGGKGCFPVLAGYPWAVLGVVGEGEVGLLRMSVIDWLAPCTGSPWIVVRNER